MHKGMHNEIRAEHKNNWWINYSTVPEAYWNWLRFQHNVTSIYTSSSSWFAVTLVYLKLKEHLLFFIPSSVARSCRTSGAFDVAWIFLKSRLWEHAAAGNAPYNTIRTGCLKECRKWRSKWSGDVLYLWHFVRARQKLTSGGHAALYALIEKIPSTRKIWLTS